MRGLWAGFFAYVICVGAGVGGGLVLSRQLHAQGDMPAVFGLVGFVAGSFVGVVAFVRFTRL